MATKKDVASILLRSFPYLQLKDVNYAIEKVTNYLTDSLIKGDRIEIRGFGSFSVRQRKYAKKMKQYNTIYYRMSKGLHCKFNNTNNALLNS